MKDTLSFSHLRLANVGYKTGVSRADKGEIVTRLFEAQLAVYGKANVGGVDVLLAVIFPPANRTEPHRAGGIQGPIPTTGAAEQGCGALRGLRVHALIDG